jgi:hypothetical protein
LALGALAANPFSKSERRRQPTYAAPPPPPQYSQGYAPPPPPQYGYQPAPQAYAAAPYPAPRPATAYNTSYCREYTSTTVIDGVSRVTHGTACRQADGSWRIVN